MILGIDTSTPWLSLALRQQGKSLGSSHGQSPWRHNETILPELQNLFQKAESWPQALKGIAVGLGPGSFTGVRVGIATALGFAQALEIPIIGVSSFLVIAAGSGQASVLLIDDARQNYFYCAWYVKAEGHWQAMLPESLFTLADLQKHWPAAPCFLAGTGVGILQAQAVLPPDSQVLPQELHHPRAETLVGLADGTMPSPVAGQLQAGGMAWDKLVPIYLRKTQAEERYIQRSY